MIVRKVEEVKPLEVNEEAEGVKIKVLIGEEEGALNFIMRYFSISPKGSISYHAHDWEHEIFVLHGRGVIRGENALYVVEPGSFVYIPPKEKHSFENPFEEPFEFLCLIPKG
ncbi:MAG: cupin domain-containing protein [Synergistetes bacterium]|nr:cupin domain-containing protein [Synergistota bacterium]MCX8127280.1 cupin domain-containing protein [Synergistota bacterium]MDW8191834.1 cupin domain-containing protein [Synergistota bacterium]